MKLAIAIFRYFPYGGLQRDMLAIAREALARGHQVTVFCGSWQGEVPEGLVVREVKHFAWFDIAGVLGFYRAFTREFKRAEFDLLLGFNKMPGLDMYFAGDSCFAQKAFVERNWLYRLTARSRLYLRFEEAVFGEASRTKILSLAAQEQKRYARFYSTAPERFVSVPPGISAQHIYCANPLLARQQVRAELGLKPNCKIILCLGSGFRTKGVDKSISIFAELLKHQPEQQFALVVIGEGDTDTYRRQAAQLGVGERLVFLGARSPIGDYLAAADLLLHSARKELAGNALIEAMAVGLPVVATQDCGYAPLVEEACLGELFAFNDSPPAIVARMLRTLAIPAAVLQERAALFRLAHNLFDRATAVVNQLESHLVDAAPGEFRLDDARQRLVLRDEMIQAWQGTDVFAQVRQLQGQVVRKMPDRLTQRFELNGRSYYCKWHRGVGWWEIVKNLLQWRLPVLGARDEWRALNKLRALQIPSLTPLAYGEQKCGAAKRQSFLVTRELQDVMQLDDFVKQRKPSIKLKRLLIAEVARITRELHTAGINHRDLYLCHFMLREKTLNQRLAQNLAPELFVIDLHRAQLRVEVPRRWLIKDLGALYFSSLDLQLSRGDKHKFLAHYLDQRQSLSDATLNNLIGAVLTRVKRFANRESLYVSRSENG